MPSPDLAETGLDQTWDYVAERFGFDVADRVPESLHDAFRLLAENPGHGARAGKDIAAPSVLVPAGRAITHRVSSGCASDSDRSRRTW